MKHQNQLPANDFGTAIVRAQYADLKMKIYATPEFRARSMTLSLLHFTQMVYDLTPEASRVIDHARAYAFAQDGVQ